MRSSVPTSSGESHDESPRALPDGSARFSRRVLLAAFLISIVAHAFLASGVRYDALRPKNDDVEKVTLTHRPLVVRVSQQTPPPRTPTPPPHTPPPNTPPPSASPAAAPSRAPSPAPSGNRSAAAQTNGTGGNGTALQTTAPATAVPSVAPSAVAACPNPQASPALAASPPPVDFGADVRKSAVSGVVKIRVDVDVDGRPTQVAMQVSSGNAAADAALIAMARAAQYTPAYKDCKPAPGQYMMAVRLAPW